MLVTAAIAPLIARFYHEPRVVFHNSRLRVWLSVGGLTVQHESTLARQMRFMALAGRRSFQSWPSVVTAILLAWHGAGYWAGGRGAELEPGVPDRHLDQCGWRPGYRREVPACDRCWSLRRTSPGSVSSTTSRATSITCSSVGGGGGGAGVYAKGLSVVVAATGSNQQPDHRRGRRRPEPVGRLSERYRQAYLRILEKIAIMTMPLMAFMIVTSDWLVLLLLGPKWTGVSRIFAAGDSPVSCSR